MGKYNVMSYKSALHRELTSEICIFSCILRSKLQLWAKGVCQSTERLEIRLCNTAIELADESTPWTRALYSVNHVVGPKFNRLSG